jgi:hypothetical protein
MDPRDKQKPVKKIKQDSWFDEKWFEEDYKDDYEEDFDQDYDYDVDSYYQEDR